MKRAEASIAEAKSWLWDEFRVAIEEVFLLDSRKSSLKRKAGLGSDLVCTGRNS